ncbi:hypothetical protein IP88_06050 [alpha proteobacterium AAP81b]|nr:hypothetical protein IP88_06050 [alpha proteobacterium AAP81b]
MARIRRLAADTDDLFAALGALTAEAVAHGASIGFMAGFSAADGAQWWRGQCGPGTLTLVALDNDGLAGTVSLGIAMPPNQPHRADVKKMIVARRAQGRGLGAALLAAIEAEARALGRTTLVLDTISGSTAARLYERCGWQRVGAIAAYALLPDGAMAPTTVYARHL